MLSLSEMHYVDGVTPEEQHELAGYERLVGSAFTIIDGPHAPGAEITAPRFTMLAPTIVAATAWRRLLSDLRSIGLGQYARWRGDHPRPMTSSR